MPGSQWSLTSEAIFVTHFLGLPAFDCCKIAGLLAGWGRGAVGSAPRWHRGGRGFESLRLHQSPRVWCPQREWTSNRLKIGALIRTVRPRGTLVVFPRELFFVMLRNLNAQTVSKWIKGETRSAVEHMGELAQSLSWVRDEAELVAELQAGSDSAFDYLVTYYHSSVYNLVYGILSDAADAADVTQEVFLRVFRGIHGFRC